jgi:hypothetical protein
MQNKPNIWLDNIFKVTEWEYDTEDPFNGVIIGNMTIKHTSGQEIYIDPRQSSKEFYKDIIGRYLVGDFRKDFNIGWMYTHPDEIHNSYEEEEGIYPDKIVGTLYLDPSDKKFHIQTVDLNLICDFTYYPDLWKKIREEYIFPKKVSISSAYIHIYLNKIRHLSSSIQDLVSTLLREQNIEPTDEMVDEIVRTFHFEDYGLDDKELVI